MGAPLIRLTGGSLGGQLIHGPKGPGVRPTSTKVRRSLFDVLQDVEGNRVLDIFAGTGALGIEAFSRGASEVVFVDRQTDLLRENLSKLQLEESSNILEMQAGDAVALLDREGRQFDLILIDPPWAQGQSLLKQAWSLRAPAGRLVLEYATRRTLVPLGDMPDPRIFVYGDTSLALFK